MTIEMTEIGTLQIQVQSKIEAYAIRTWIRESMTMAEHLDYDYVKAGSLSILSQNGNELTDVFIGGNNE